MPQIKQFRLPDVGEGLTEAEIVSWKVRPGDTIKVNHTIVEIETAKSLVELPSPFAGVVTELMVDEGQTVDVGTPIISVDVDPAGAPSANGGTPTMPAESAEIVPSSPSDVETPPEHGAVEPGMVGGPASGGRQAVLVGYGPRTTEAKRRPRHVAATAVATEPVAAPVTATPQPAAPVIAGAKVLAKPPVRKLTKDLGVDLRSLRPSGPGGVVTRDDVLAAGEAPAPTAAAARPGERETRIPVKGVRRMTAQAVTASAFTAPHVTEFVAVDVTRTVRLVERLRADREFEGVKVSPLLVVAKALLIAVRRNPEINARWDEQAQEIVLKHYVNLGIAASTPRGLVVPNVKDADRMTLRELAEALGELTQRAREGRTQPAEMADGTISITNVGVFGVDTGTPILNNGEAAILCFGQVRQMPWVHKGKVKPRWVTQLGLSFDHRLVDGDLGSRFLADIAAVLEDPSRALVWS
ncbi:MAG: dihydrolipoamide acetyltransferase family protein [Actinomycetes bacterium]